MASALSSALKPEFEVLIQAYFLSLVADSEVSVRAMLGSKEVRAEVADSPTSGVPVPPSDGVGALGIIL